MPKAISDATRVCIVERLGAGDTPALAAQACGVHRRTAERVAETVQKSNDRATSERWLAYVQSGSLSAYLGELRSATYEEALSEAKQRVSTLTITIRRGAMPDLQDRDRVVVNKGGLRNSIQAGRGARFGRGR